MENSKLPSFKDLDTPQAWMDLLEYGKKQVHEYPMTSLIAATGLGFAMGFTGLNKVFMLTQVALKPALKDFDAVGLVLNAIKGNLNDSPKANI